jgi:putative transposase
MTTVRNCPSGDTYFITRRCFSGLMMLTPKPWVVRLFGYCLAVSAERHGIELHAYTVMSNHWHGVLTDPEGRLSDFLCHLHSLLARALNQGRGRTDGVWSRQPTNLVRVWDADSLLEKMTYVITNPVKAGLTSTSEEWPGLRGAVGVRGAMCGIQKKPKNFFKGSGPCPAEVNLRLTPPSLWAADPEGYRRRLLALIATKEEAVRATMKKERRGFLGRREAQRQRWDRRPKKSLKRSVVVPRVAASDAGLRVAMLREEAVFQSRYRDALKLWKEGVRPVVFPEGTVKMRNYPGVVIAGTPKAEALRRG